MFEKKCGCLLFGFIVATVMLPIFIGICIVNNYSFIDAVLELSVAYIVVFILGVLLFELREEQERNRAGKR